MTSRRESKIQILIQVMKDRCKGCSKKKYEECMVCEYHIFMNERMKQVEGNGGGIE